MGSMISTRNLTAMPDIASFRRLTRALAMLDAIMSPEWEHRYYSFKSQWADEEMLASMRNGSGDHWFALLCKKGIALNGLSHEAPMFRPGKPWPGLFEGLPVEFQSNFLREPAFDTDNTTFCIWRRAMDDSWSRGAVRFPAGADPDGSEDLLRILSGNAGAYVEFARDYFEVSLSLAAVTAVYEHHILTSELVAQLNPNASVAALAKDIAEIGYPERIQ